ASASASAPSAWQPIPAPAGAPPTRRPRKSSQRCTSATRFRSSPGSPAGARSSCASSARAPTPHWIPSTPATRSPSPGTRRRRTCSATRPTQTIRRRARDRQATRFAEHPGAVERKAEARLSPPPALSRCGRAVGALTARAARAGRPRPGRRGVRRLDQRGRWRRRGQLRGRRRQHPGRQEDREQPRHLQLVGVRRGQHVLQVQGGASRHEGDRDVLLVERRAAGEALRRRHGLRHHRPQPERRRPADHAERAHGARQGASAQPEEPRPQVPEAVVRRVRQLPRDQGLRDHDGLLHEHGRQASPEDDARLLQPPPEVRQQGPHQRPGRRGGGRPAGADGARPRPEHRQELRLRQGEAAAAQHPQGRDHDRLVGLHQRRDRREDHPQPGLERRRPPHLPGPQEAGRHHAGAARGDVGGVGGQLVHPGHGARPGRRARLDQLAARAGHGGRRDELPQLPDPDPVRAQPDAGVAEERPALQRAGQVHGQLQVHPERQPVRGEPAHADLRGVQGGLVAIAGGEPAAAATAAAEAPRRRGRGFAPRYPGWLTIPSLLYYAIFFIGPMAILAVFSVSIQSGFGSVSYAFDTSQFHLVFSGFYITVFWHTLLMATGGSLLTIAVGYPVAYWMARYLSTYKMLALLLIIVPFWTSFLIRTYALKIILDPHGYLARDFGIDVLYTKYAVGIGLVYNYLPLFILPV